MSKQYDRAYFDRWYRGEPAVAGSAADLQRKVAMVVGMAEYHLGRPITSALDIGCGEGAWRAPLLKLRPKLDYLGLDSSEYAIRRYGRQRNLRPLDFEQLAWQRFERPFDLLVCSDVMHYLPAAVLKQGLTGFSELGSGFAFIELFCRGDDFEGDTDGFQSRPAGWYRKTFAAAGWRAIGSHCYVHGELAESLPALEVAG
jgi:SAM-dependent methyltransferase